MYNIQTYTELSLSHTHTTTSLDTHMRTHRRSAMAWRGCSCSAFSEYSSARSRSSCAACYRIHSRRVIAYTLGVSALSRVLRAHAATLSTSKHNNQVWQPHTRTHTIHDTHTHTHTHTHTQTSRSGTFKSMYKEEQTQPSGLCA